MSCAVYHQQLSIGHFTKICFCANNYFKQLLPMVPRTIDIAINTSRLTSLQRLHNKLIKTDAVSTSPGIVTFYNFFNLRLVQIQTYHWFCPPFCFFAMPYLFLHCGRLSTSIFHHTKTNIKTQYF